MVRISLRTFLICCMLLGAVLGLLLRSGLKPSVRTCHEDCATAIGGNSYTVSWTTEWRPVGRERLLCARVVPTFADPAESDWQITDDGVFFRGKRTPYPMAGIFLVLGADDARTIPLSENEYAALEQIVLDWRRMTIDRNLGPTATSKRSAEIAAASPTASSIWKTKVEPRLLSVIGPWNRARRASLGQSP